MKINSILEGLTPYKSTTSLGQIAIRRKTPLKLDWNESTISPSLRVRVSLILSIIFKNNLQWYGDSKSSKINSLIAKKHCLNNESMVLLTNGSDSGLELIIHNFISFGETILIPEPSYSNFYVFARSFSNNVEKWKWSDPIKPSVDELIAKIKQSTSTKIVYISNPNNPTGVYIDQKDIDRLCSLFPNILFIIDESYADFANKTVIPSVNKFNNLIITRTFSKAYGLAGLRLGYIIAQEEIIYSLSKIHNFKSVNKLALIAGIAALKSQKYTDKYINRVIKSRQFLYKELHKRGIKAYLSKTNFLLAEVKDSKEFISSLESQNVYVRDVSNLDGIDTSSVRITVGTKRQMKIFLKRLDKSSKTRAKKYKKSLFSFQINVISNIKRCKPSTLISIINQNKREFSAKKLKDYQNIRFKELFDFVVKNNDFYREFWLQNGVDLSKINSIDDLHKLPIVSKDDLRKATSNKKWFSKTFNEKTLLPTSTTGSSGEPFTVYRDRKSNIEKNIFSLRMMKWIGYNIGDRFVVIWRKKKYSSNEKILNKLNIFKRIDVLDINNPFNSSFDKSKLAKIVAELETFRPKIIRGYPSALWLLSEYIIDNKIKTISPKAIIASAEGLSPIAEEKIKNAFKTKIFNLYGATEAPLVALTCPKCNLMHVMSDCYLVEIVGQDGLPIKNEEVGEIVITDLTLKGAPLIRYKIGDLATWSKNPCSCGRCLPCFQKIYGRTNDFFILPDGRKIISHSWHIYFRDNPNITRFQVIQEKPDIIKVKYILKEGSTSDSLNDLKEKFNRMFLGIKFIWEEVKFFPLSKGGKFQAVKSLVDNEFNNIND